MKKIICKIILILLSVAMLSGCSYGNLNQNNSKNGVINISLLNSKPEIQIALEDSAKQFNKENPDIKIKVVKYSQTQDYYEKLNSMYAYGNAPTMTLIDPNNIKNIQDNLVDLSSETWIKEITGGVADISKDKSGKIVAFPFALEGIGLIYNSKVISQAGIDVSKINTINALEDALKKVEALGKKGVIITNESWSLGDHFLSTAYSAQDKNTEGINNYINKIKSGDVKLKEDSKINGLVNTLDVMKKYNIYKNNPLAPSYNKCSEVLGKGEVGFWYMGNWASKLILDSSSDSKEYGFIPLPISNNSSDYGNNEITAGVTKYIVIDKKNNSVEQQQAAKKFLNWIVYNKEGQDFMVNKAGVITVFKNNTIKQTDPLAKSIVEYQSKGKIMQLVNSYLPADNSANVGVALRKYITGEFDRNKLLDTIQQYWQKQK